MLYAMFICKICAGITWAMSTVEPSNIHFSNAEKFSSKTLLTGSNGLAQNVYKIGDVQCFV